MTEKSCLIIGGSRGMGAATVREMRARLQAGTYVTLGKLRGAGHRTGRRGAPQKGRECRGYEGDLRTHCGELWPCRRLPDPCRRPAKDDLLEIPKEDWDRVNEMILKPVIRMAELLTPAMEAQGGGSIVNITTFSAFEPLLTFPTSSVYRVGFSSLAKLYSDRYGPANICMNCLLLGFTDSLDLPQKFA